MKGSSYLDMSIHSKAKRFAVYLNASLDCVEINIKTKLKISFGVFSFKVCL
ncbi:MAG: hypothetical protein LBM19_02220 [Holosporales bacterium]|jgi:hypothetical protein|nr:hypothetical protein [Holosporales bacterium]